MTNPDDLEKAVAAVDGFVQRWESRIGTGAQTSDTIYCVTVNGFEGEAELRASDLRLILSANREMREALEVSAVELVVASRCLREAGDKQGARITLQASNKARSALTTQRGDGE